jgi:hypothetical protein
VALALAAALASCASYSAEGDAGLAAFALPEAHAARAARILEGRRDLVNEWNFTLPASDFSRVVTMSANEAFARIRVGDPRRTPLIDGLAAAFRIRVDGEAWAIMYLARGSDALFDTIDELGRAGIEPLAASHARPLHARAGSYPAGGAGGLAAALALSLWYLLRLGRGDRLFRAIIGLAWLPFVATPSFAGALAALTTAAFAGELALTLRRRRPTSGELAYAVLIYGPALSFSAASDPIALIPACAAAAWIAAAVIKREPLLARCNASRLHTPPAFVQIAPPAPIYGHARAALRLIAPVAIVVAVALVSNGVPRSDRDGRPRIAEGLTGLAVEFIKLDPGLEGMNPMVAHAAYQVSLTWGRLGDAAWGRFDLEGLMPPPGIKTTNPKEIARESFGTNALHKALDSGYIPTVRAAEPFVTAVPHRGVSFLALLAALAPAISLFIYGRLRSR